jgi:hypothetical protein
VFTSPKAIRFYKTGGPEVLVWEEVRVGNPGPGEARLRHTAVGLNYVDIYVRRGLYPVPLPSGLGYTYEDFVERIETITQGRKLPVVYDSVGKTPLLIFDPIGLLPLFVALTHRQRKERRRIATRSIAVAAITLVVVALVGHLVLRLLGIGLPAFRIAGGLLLLLLSIDMVFARHSGIRSTTAAETEEAEDSSDVAIFPLAIPLVAGPRRDDVDHPAHGAGGWRFHPSSDRGCRDVVCARPMLGGVSVCHTSHGTARCDRHQRRRSRFRHRSCGAGCAICH